MAIWIDEKNTLLIILSFCAFYFPAVLKTFLDLIILISISTAQLLLYRDTYNKL